ncbi:hypothetical protein B0T14DRAFT_336578 [Immersiella caudata]|uniref:Uncharacterized protein n=1 Tax=Immersiella caudata TaxID=314043 RepID=A0AA39TYI1_9PEZI|nr:hypothetical protein B0T14DRAFT_336578 [Immersiella caudata]
MDVTGSHLSKKMSSVTSIEQSLAKTFLYLLIITAITKPICFLGAAQLLLAQAPSFRQSPTSNLPWGKRAANQQPGTSGLWAQAVNGVWAAGGSPPRGRDPTRGLHFNFDPRSTTSRKAWTPPSNLTHRALIGGRSWYRSCLLLVDRQARHVFNCNIIWHSGDFCTWSSPPSPLTVAVSGPQERPPLPPSLPCPHGAGLGLRGDATATTCGS